MTTRPRFVRSSRIAAAALIGGAALYLVAETVSASRLRGRLRRISVALTVGTTVGCVLLACFHGSAQAAEDGTLALHFMGATFAILGANTLAIVLGTEWRKDPATRSLGRVAVAARVVALIAVVVLFSSVNSGLPAGLIERISVYISVLWPVGLAVQLLRSSRPVTGVDADAPTVRTVATAI